MELPICTNIPIYILFNQKVSIYHDSTISTVRPFVPVTTKGIELFFGKVFLWEIMRGSIRNFDIPFLGQPSRVFRLLRISFFKFSLPPSPSAKQPVQCPTLKSSNAVSSRANFQHFDILVSPSKTH